MTLIFYDLLYRKEVVMGIDIAAERVEAEKKARAASIALEKKQKREEYEAFLKKEIETTKKKFGGPQWICPQCGTPGKEKTYTKGSLGLEIFWWIFGIGLCWLFLFTLLIPLCYSGWRIFSRYKGCPLCKAEMIKTSSPKGKKLMAEAFPEEQQTINANPDKDWKKISVAIDRLLEKYIDLITALVFIARADGQMRENEKNIIIDICLQLSDYKEIPRYKIEFILNDVRTSGIDFKNLIEKIALVDRSLIKILSEVAGKIINTQKVISSGEQFCLDKIKECSPGLTNK